MSVLTVATFLGLLAVAAFIGVALVLVVWVLDRIGVARGTIDGLQRAIGPAGLWLAFAVALTATAGSLYFSEVAGFPPCALCWYQRIAMYPQVIILGVAAARGDAGVIRYAGPLAAIGALDLDLAHRRRAHSDPAKWLLLARRSLLDDLGTRCWAS